MEGDSGDGGTCPQLELRLGPPGGVGGGQEGHRALKNRAQSSQDCHEPQPLLSSFSCLHSQSAHSQHSQGFPSTLSQSERQRVPYPKEPERVGMELNDSIDEAFSPNPTAPNSSQKRTAPAPVVGWPPVRSFRKNLPSTSIKQAEQPPPPSASESQTEKKPGSEKPIAVKNGTKTKGFFVKINMDGVPIGRKVDLRAYDTYEKLSAAVDELFRDLLAAQRDSSAVGIRSNEEKEQPFTCILDGIGEYTLVYEDYEGDMMLVGDIPWQMFVSTVKRLRVLKSSELSVLSIGCRKQEKVSGEALH